MSLKWIMRLHGWVKMQVSENFAEIHGHQFVASSPCYYSYIHIYIDIYKRTLCVPLHIDICMCKFWLCFAELVPLQSHRTGRNGRKVDGRRSEGTERGEARANFLRYSGCKFHMRIPTPLQCATLLIPIFSPLHSTAFLPPSPSPISL